MDASSSGEELVVKTRKPYIITKQRERWTDEEHNRFLQALKLYGRAWQRIEEHIGTKTAVQIRSHAQKFFSKLEKEASVKGVPLGQTHDIEIPPPRPKKKPSNPYPRKTSKVSISLSGESIFSSSNNKNVHLSKVASSKEFRGTELLERTEGSSENGNCSEVLTLLQDASCASFTSINKIHRNQQPNREFISLALETESKRATDIASSVTKKTEEPLQESVNYTYSDVARSEGLVEMVEVNGIPFKNEQDGVHNYPKPVHLHSIDEDNEKCGKTLFSDSENERRDPNLARHLAYPYQFNSSAIAATSELHMYPSMSVPCQQLPNFCAYSECHSNQDAYRSFLNISSTFSNLIASSLLQNPASHAANLAASSWLSICAEKKKSDSPVSGTFIGGVPAHSINFPHLSAIASATVAAATAWWATHGFFPFCHPSIPAGCTFASSHTTTVPVTETKRSADYIKESAIQIDAKDKELVQDLKRPSVLNNLNCAAKSSQLDCDGSAHAERSDATDVSASQVNDLVSTPDTDLNDSNNGTRSKKIHDRSSCGSNTPSSSEETDAILEKLDESKEILKQAQNSHVPAGETSNRRSRSTMCINESWKEVSEEGRLAFQALFSREVLPQSFSPPHAEDTAMKLYKKERGNNTLLVDLNSKACADSEFEIGQGFKETPIKSTSQLDQIPSTSEIGQARLKTERTGFKPYKRCLFEANVDGSIAGDDKGKKKIRVEHQMTRAANI